MTMNAKNIYINICADFRRVQRYKSLYNDDTSFWIIAPLTLRVDVEFVSCNITLRLKIMKVYNSCTKILRDYMDLADLRLF